MLALDLDPVSVSSATENAKLNGLERQITVKLSDLLQVINEHRAAGASEGTLGVKLPVQVVVANILAEIILMFVDDVYEVLESGGTYIVSGIIKAKKASVEEALTAAGFIITERHEEQDWVVLVARKP